MLQPSAQCAGAGRCSSVSCSLSVCCCMNGVLGIGTSRSRGMCQIHTRAFGVVPFLVLIRCPFNSPFGRWGRECSDFQDIMIIPPQTEMSERVSAQSQTAASTSC